MNFYKKKLLSLFFRKKEKQKKLALTIYSLQCIINNDYCLLTF